MDSLEVMLPPRTFWNCNDPTLMDPFDETLVPTMASPLEAVCSSTFLFPSTSSSDDRTMNIMEEAGGSESRAFAPSQLNSWLPAGQSSRYLASAAGHGQNNGTMMSSFRGQLSTSVVKGSWQSTTSAGPSMLRVGAEPLGSPCSVISGSNMESFQQGPSSTTSAAAANDLSEPAAKAPVKINNYASQCSQESSAVIVLQPLQSSVHTTSTKRKRSKVPKLSNEVESQRMTHIAVERNRRKQMNEHLAALRALMPGSYVQKGDQASIVGGAIEFVKELEHLLHCLQSQKRRRAYSELSSGGTPTSRLAMPNPEPQFFHNLQPPISFHNPHQGLVDQSPFLLKGGGAAAVPVLETMNRLHGGAPGLSSSQAAAGSSSNQQQQMMAAASSIQSVVDMGGPGGSSSSSSSGAGAVVGEARSEMASVEVKLLVGGNAGAGAGAGALVKIMALRRGGQLLRTLVALESLALTVLHTNITTVGNTVLYSFHVQINNNNGTHNVDHIAHALHQTFASIHALQF